MQKKYMLLFSIIALLLISSSPAFSNVNLKNGNFYMSYTDVIYSGGFEPKIERVYNSKSPFKGIFGSGWGSIYEVHLAFNADGSISAHEWGSGAENLFYPETVKPGEIESAISEIASAAIESREPAANADIDAYRKRLGAESSFRNEEWDKYMKLGLLRNRELPVGATLRSDRFGHQYIKKTREGYVRVYNDSSEVFDIQGRLIRIVDKNNNFLDVAYSAAGKMKKITDNFGRSINIKFNGQGLVEKIIDDHGKEAEYRYDDKGNLIYSKDVDGNIHEYDYDERFNMTDIRYADGTSMEINYYSMELHENVRSKKDKDGSVALYSYSYDPNDKLHYSVSVNIRDSEDNSFSDSVYEYFNKVDLTGNELTYKMITIIDGDRTATEYNEAGVPIKITRPEGETIFQYDDKNRVIYKETLDGEVTHLEYHKTIGKIVHVKNYHKDNPEKALESKFKYDDAGNLLYAENSEGNKVNLKYDNLGRISELISIEGTISFEYNNNSKPVKIILKDVGNITVTYNENGEILKVDSDKGRDIALKVTSAFQDLLYIIRPAGVSLSF